MAVDSQSSNPVRTQNPGDIVAQIGDGTVPTQKLSISASGAISLTNFGSASGGTAATVSGLFGGIYNSVLPTLTSGQQASIQLDSSGRQLVVIAASTGLLLTSDAADGPVAPGTVASKSILIGGQYNTTLPSFTTGQQGAIQFDSSGRIILGTSTAVIGSVNQGTSPWLVSGTGTAGTPATGVVTVQGIAGGTAIPVTITSGTTAVTQGTTPWVTSDLADGPVTPGTVATKSILIGGQYNSALPALTTGQQAAAQLDSSGRLLVGSIASSLPAGSALIGGTNVYVGGTIASATNPVPVTLSPGLTGTPVNKYLSSSNLAIGGSVTLPYVVTTGKILSVKKLWASAPGKIRVDWQTSPDGATFTTFWTSFNSASNPNISIDLGEAVLATATGNGTANIQAVISNDDILILNIVSATISGNEQ